MIKKDVYDELERRFKDVASWAIWTPEGAKPSSHTGDMTVFDKPNLLDLIHSDFVLVALNASEHGDRKDGYTGSWRMFHSDYSYQKDFKLRYAIAGTKYEGAYMTDVIKNHPDKNSKKVQAYIKENPHVLVENLKVLKEELEILGGKPVLVAMGQAVQKYLIESDLSKEYDIVSIEHYSNRDTSKQELRKQLISNIKEIN